VRITGWSGVTIRDVAAKTISLSGESALVNIEVELLGDSGREAELILLDEESGKRFSKNVSCGDKITTVDFELYISDPQLWWPAGLGAQALQRYTAEVYIDSVIIDSAGLCFGLRTIELVTDKDEAGESFYFKINNVPVFMKGANWIPMDSFLPRPSPAGYRRLMTAAKDANMNMLRVWGGGIYENDIFYDLCDSLGIMVWQDFMYACAMYPGDREFLESAGQEATRNIIRLRNHPCLAIWCGNNENDEGWQNWGWKKDFYPDQRDEIWKAYEDLFTGVLPAAVETYDAGAPGHIRAYHPSSPRYGRADPKSLTEGDAHYWGVWHDAEPFEILEEKIPRFMSEFGFQSLPSMRTIEMFTGPDERRLDSAAMLSHQKHPRGYDLIREYMERWYRVPEKFEDYVYVSQLLQAEGMRIGVAAQRRAMPYCMGTLYWQLNDCWPAVSWSSIDYSGEWKALHYAAKRAFEPLLVSTVEKEGSLHVYIVSDRLEELGGWISMKLTGFDGTVLWERVLTVKAPSNGSLDIFSILLEELLSGSDRSSVVFSAVFDCPGERPSRAIRYFAHPKDLKLPDPRFEYTILDGHPGVIFSMRAYTLAKNVFLHLDGEGHFSDNFFDILPGGTATLRIDTDIPRKQLKGRITIKTLRDTY
jgi:beta-mannosidase